MPSSPQNTVVPLLVGLVRTIRDCCQRKEGEICRKLALTASQLACLLALPEQGGQIKVRQVAQAMGLSPSRASRVVDSLVNAGLLDRRTADGDRRVQRLGLTAAGRKKWQAAHRLLVDCEQKVLSQLTPQGSRELAETLQNLIDLW